MTKSKKTHGVKACKEKSKKHYLKLIKEGEMLGENLIIMLSEYGSSHDSLMIETYAMSKAFAALKAIAEDKGFESDLLFYKLLPSFIDEMREAVKEE